MPRRSSTNSEKQKYYWPQAITVHALLGLVSLGIVALLIPKLWKRPTSEARDTGEVRDLPPRNGTRLYKTKGIVRKG